MRLGLAHGGSGGRFSLIGFRGSVELLPDVSDDDSGGGRDGGREGFRWPERSPGCLLHSLTHSRVEVSARPYLKVPRARSIESLQVLFQFD